ncbi:MAG TPA: tripartite tricarboxylate transporter TctB family protein [Candidatus Methylomirabilis sp.]|jgi:putative tricarboxylic transport membrane protein
MLTTDRLAGAALAAFALAVIWECRTLPFGGFRHPGPGYMPFFLAAVLLACGVLLVVFGGTARPWMKLGWSEGRHAVAILGVCAFAALALERLGYRLTVLIFLAVLLRVVERKGYAVTAALALGIAFGSFYLFNTVLRVPLPRGPFAF